MQIDEMRIFMQEGVDRTGSQAYTVSHGKQTMPTKDSRKGYRTMNAVCFGMMMCMMDMGMMTMPKPLCASAKNLSCV